jgi:hypothetical protein
MSPYIRTAKTASGARAAQIAHSSHRGSRDIEHIGSPRNDAELASLKTAAGQRRADGQGESNLGLEVTEPTDTTTGAKLPILASSMGHLCDAIGHV